MEQQAGTWLDLTETNWKRGKLQETESIINAMMMIFKGTDLESNCNLSMFFSVENWCQRDDRLSIALQRPELPISADQQPTGVQK